jgi:hypothetical protein
MPNKIYTYYIKDNELGQVFRVRSLINNANKVLAAYLREGTDLTPKEAAEAAHDFNGEIWSESDIVDANFWVIE